MIECTNWKILEPLEYQLNYHLLYKGFYPWKDPAMWCLELFSYHLFQAIWQSNEWYEKKVINALRFSIFFKIKTEYYLNSSYKKFRRLTIKEISNVYYFNYFSFWENQWIEYCDNIFVKQWLVFLAFSGFSFFGFQLRRNSTRRIRFHWANKLKLGCARFGEFWLFFNEQVFTLHRNAMRRAIKAHKNLHTNQQNEHTPDILWVNCENILNPWHGMIDLNQS